MNIYYQKKRWKLVLLIVAVMIGVLSLWYTNKLMNKLSEEERKRIELWAEATQRLINSDNNDDISFLFEVQRNNSTIPVLLVDNDNTIISFRNLDSLKMKNSEFQEKVLKEFQSNLKDYFVITTDDGQELSRIYYSDSVLLKQLQYYPYVQLGIIALFIIVSYFAFSIARKSEQNHVWLGMSKETAHQLGTPISSLMAWIEVMKMNKEDDELISEVEKDIKRLEKITARFSKIGSQPNLKDSDILFAIKNSVDYIKARTPKTVLFTDNFDNFKSLSVPFNVELFEWVVENLCKNSVDAISGEGKISILVQDEGKNVLIDFTDNGKGIPKSQHKAIFQPGFTTKSRGWGLGLSLSKRIIEQYHKGKIFVKTSDIGVGTTIRINLKKT
jgi:signal transduction histidine kinase